MDSNESNELDVTLDVSPMLAKHDLMSISLDCFSFIDDGIFP
jgi:hypothetical protein